MYESHGDSPTGNLFARLLNAHIDYALALETAGYDASSTWSPWNPIDDPSLEPITKLRNEADELHIRLPRDEFMQGVARAMLYTEGRLSRPPWG